MILGSKCTDETAIFNFKCSNYIKQYIQLDINSIYRILSTSDICNSSSVAMYNYDNTRRQFNHNKSAPTQSKAINSYDIVTIEASINTVLWINK